MEDNAASNSEQDSKEIPFSTASSATLTSAAASAEKDSAPPIKMTMSDDNDWDKVDADLLDESEESSADLIAASRETANHKNGNDNEKETEEEKEKALQIVSIGSKEDQYAFQFHPEALESILSRIPTDHHVCVISVVGAFRTGKSFLLSWFLNYLDHLESGNSSNVSKNVSATATASTGRNATSDNDNAHDNTTSSNMAAGAPSNERWFDSVESLKEGFEWRGGAERNTTGIWMWTHPFLLPPQQNHGGDDGNGGDSPPIALLLVDTQGMFDHETTMGLTAAIFGLSTLLSSYQIYNVDKRIQEDHLQQLALFTEYGRMALSADAKSHGDDDHDNNNTTSDKAKPFQKIEFLVRDWQNFEDDDDIPACRTEMESYLSSVLATRDASDLAETRSQIHSCFQDISAFLLPHPGFGVTNKKYKGEISKVEPTFLNFIHDYCTHVFTNPIPKVIHGRTLTAPELGAYITNYANMFSTGAQFPEASTMLEATSAANNSNASSLSRNQYKALMDGLAGPNVKDYLSPSELEQGQEQVWKDCMDLFDGIATFGNVKAIEVARKEVCTFMEENYEMYFKLNEGRNPLAGFETYIVPLLIGFVSILLRTIADWTCTSWSQTCRAGSEVLSHIYQVVFFFLVIVASTKAKQVSEAAGRIKKALEVVSGADNGGGTKTKRE